MCRGGRLVADFVAGTQAQPDLPEALDEYLTTTVDGLWVVWAHKLALPMGDLFVPLTGGFGYPAGAPAEGPRPGVRWPPDGPHPGRTGRVLPLSPRHLPARPTPAGAPASTAAPSP